jgi:hypothetical protein
MSSPVLMGPLHTLFSANSQQLSGQRSAQNLLYLYFYDVIYVPRSHGTGVN